MFQYALTQPVTVLQNQSAMVPIVQARVDAEKVTLWNARERSPLRALWLTNSSGLTLDAGSFNIVEGGSFAGEGLLAEVHPERAPTHLLRRRYGGARQKPDQQRAEALHATQRRPRNPPHDPRTARDAHLHGHQLGYRRAQRSSSSIPRARDGTSSTRTLKPEETSNSYHRFRLKVAPGTHGQAGGGRVSIRRRPPIASPPSTTTPSTWC